MPWTPLPRLAFAICTYPFVPSQPADLPLQIGDELYIIEEGGKDGSWFRGYLVAPPSLLSGLTSSRGQTLEKRVFTGIFPRVCVEIRELLGDATGHERSVSGADRPLKRKSVLDQPELTRLSLRRPPDGDTFLSPASPVDPPTLAGAGAGAAHDESSVTDRSAFTSATTPTAHDTAASSLGTSASSPHKPPAPVPMLKIGDESTMTKDEPLVDEIASCLREWHSTTLHELLLSRQYGTIDKMSALVARLDVARKQLFHEVLTDHELHKLREQTVWDLVRGNKMLGQDIVVRGTAQKGRILTWLDSAVEINNQQAMMSLLEEPPLPQAESKAPFHVYINLRSFTSDSDRQTTLGLCLYSKRAKDPPKLLSEQYTVEATSSFPGMTIDFDGLRKTLFTDIGPSDAGEGPNDSATVFLVVKMVTNEPPILPQNLQAMAAAEGETQESAISNLGATFRSASQAGLKSGRQSLMWVRGRKRKDSDTDLKPPGRLGTGISEQSQSSDPFSPRDGAMSDESKRTKPVKKLTGLGVIDISRQVRALQENELAVIVESADVAARQAKLNHDDRSQVIAHIVGSDKLQGPNGVTSASLRLSMKVFRADSSDDLIQDTPTLLHNITSSQRLGFASAPRRPRSDIYVTLQRPVIHDNANLSHPRVGALPAFGDDNLCNLQLTLEVRDTHGQRIDKCIYPSANSTGHVAWRSTAVERGEWWNQTIRLAIKPDQVPGSHIVMSLAEGYNFPFALAWMPLWVQGAFVQDGAHSLALYKYDEHTSSNHSGKGAYLSLPWTMRNKDPTVTGPLAWLEISTYLCSTAYSQDNNLLKLLHWREKRHDEMIKVLHKFTFVPEIEIVKLLREVFNALFGAMVDYAGDDEIQDLLFNALIYVLGIVNDRRFNLQPLVDDYADNDFQYPFAFACLVSGFSQLLQDPKNPEKSRRLRSTCKVSVYVIKFIVKAREQQLEKEADIGIKSRGASFAKDLSPIFQAVKSLMMDPNPILVGTKTLMVQNFHAWLPELADAAPIEEVFDMASDFIDSCSTVQGKLVLYKLLLLKQITDGDVFTAEKTGSRWESSVAEWLAPHWGMTDSPNLQWREQIRLGCSIVSSLFSKFGPNTNIFTRKLTQSSKMLPVIPKAQGDEFSLLFPSTYPFPSRPTRVTDSFDEALIEIAALLSATTSLPADAYVDLPVEELGEILQDTLTLMKSLLEFEAFPSNWLSVHIYNHRTANNALEAIYSILLRRYLPLPDDAQDFRDDIWRNYLETLLLLVSSDALALETFPEQKRRAVWKIGGDVRESGADLLARTWNALGWETSPQERDSYGLDRMGGYQVSYVPGLVGAVLELCLSVHESLRNVATGIIHSMIVGEWTLNESLAAIETAMIDSLDELYTNKPLTDGMLQKQFIDELRQRFRSLGKNIDVRLFSAAMGLLDTIGELFDLLIAVHAPEASSGTLQVMDTLRLLDYLRDMAKVDIFIGYVYKLSQIQQSSGNLTEAALALKMHADLYEWDSTVMLPALAEPAFPAQSSFDRRERIYFEMINLFEDAEDWHQALGTYSELAQHYQNTVYDFTKLARSQRAMATIYEKISNGERQQPRFFRVIYRGLGFPTSLRDRQFIFQALPSDRLASFTDKMQQQYPAAQVVGGGALDEIEGQYLSIFPISPQKDFAHPVNRRLRTAQPTKEYLMMAAPRLFANTTRRQATGTSVEDQMQEKVVYTTAEPFPTVTRRSEVVATETVRMTPVQIGLERTMRKTQELQTRINALADGGEAALSAMTDDLVSLVGRDSTGTVAAYWKLVARAPLAAAPGKAGALADPFDAALKVALVDHVLMIRRALEHFARNSHQATRADLTKDLETSFAPVIAFLASLNASTTATATGAGANVPPTKSSTSITRKAIGSSPTVAAPATTEPPPAKSSSPDAGTTSVKVFGPDGATDADGARLSRAETADAHVNGAASSSSPERSRSFGAAGASKPVLSAQASIQSLGARVGSVTGSVTKRLSALNLGAGVGRKTVRGGGAPTSPVIQEAEG